MHDDGFTLHLDSVLRSLGVVSCRALEANVRFYLNAMKGNRENEIGAGISCSGSNIEGSHTSFLGFASDVITHCDVIAQLENLSLRNRNSL